MQNIYQALAEVERKNETAALCTVVHTSGSTPRHSTSKMIVYPNGYILGTVGGGELENRVRAEAIQAMKDGQPRLKKYALNDPDKGDAGVCGGKVEVFVEPILPQPDLVIIGGGHVGKAVAHLAKWLGYRVIVSDDRPEFCTPQSNPDADEFLPINMAELPLHLEISPRTSLVLTTRGSQVDVAGLPALLETSAGYIGVIGSRKRWNETCKLLNESGITDDQLRRVHSPIGLFIGAETPEEIAVSILAEIIQCQSAVPGKPNKG